MSVLNALEIWHNPLKLLLYVYVFLLFKFKNSIATSFAIVN